MTMIADPAIPDTVTKDGVVMHARLEFKGWRKRDGTWWRAGVDPESEKAEEEHDIIPHPCVIGLPDDSPRVLQEKREAAIAARADYWDPRTVEHPENHERAVVGWLTNGVKRIKDWSANHGTRVIVREKRRTPATVSDDAALVLAKAGKDKVNGT